MLRALALGARSCLIGRAYIFGLGAGGQAGVAKAIEIIRNELDVTMALCGVNSVREIDRRVLKKFIILNPSNTKKTTLSTAIRRRSFPSA